MNVMVIARRQVNRHRIGIAQPFAFAIGLGTDELKRRKRPPLDVEQHTIGHAPHLAEPPIDRRHGTIVAIARNRPHIGLELTRKKRIERLVIVDRHRRLVGIDARQPHKRTIDALLQRRRQLHIAHHPKKPTPQCRRHDIAYLFYNSHRILICQRTTKGTPSITRFGHHLNANSTIHARGARLLAQGQYARFAGVDSPSPFMEKGWPTGRG